MYHIRADQKHIPRPHHIILITCRYRYRTLFTEKKLNVFMPVKGGKNPLPVFSLPGDMKRKIL